MTNKLIAHINPQDSAAAECLREHLSLTAEYASKAGDKFNAGYLADVVSRFHDLGKSSAQFQEYIRSSAGDCEESESGDRASVKRRRGPDHSSAGAQLLTQSMPGIGHLLAYAIAGHHAGLPDGIGITTSSLQARLRKTVPEWRQAAEKHLGISWFQVDWQRVAKEVKPFLADGYSCAFLIRMLFSCLVDADFLATESFMNRGQALLRQTGDVELAELEKLLVTHYDELLRQLVEDRLDQTPVNVVREEVKVDCLSCATEPPGLFTLTVPTGGGKTLASMAFALRHAVKHGLKKVIYVIPYTSIIEQTAKVFREVFGDDRVLEHHCNVDFDNGSTHLKLLAENWDAPIVVTTSVQFFESLHANRTSRCRKLHNLAQAVIILDEAQTLPIELLHPSLRALDELVIRYGSTVVLCTATQPAISHEKLHQWGLRGNDAGIREIIRPGRNLHQRLKRVFVEKIPDKTTDDELVKLLEPFDSALIIVSTRRHARELFERVGQESPAGQIFHLSAQMCPTHRQTQLETIRSRLKDGLPCRVVSTQLIEAGVDIDFPVVFREQAGADAVAQAAGRCNREGLLQDQQGQVFIFESAEHQPPAGFLRTAAQKGGEIMSLPAYAADLLAPEVITHYFESLYHNQAAAMDRYEVLTRLLPAKRPCEQGDFFLYYFKTLGQTFKVIDQMAVSVIVPYGDEGKRLCEQLRGTFAVGEQKALARKLQRYTVGIYGQEPRDRDGNLIAELLHEVYWVLTAPEVHYSEDFGISFEGLNTVLNA